MYQEKCWAKSLNDCSVEMSKEHLLTGAILPDTVYVSGFEWCKDKPKAIGKNSLVSHCLCKAHNNFLSKFDSEANNIFGIMKEFVKNDIKHEHHGFQFKNVPIKYSVNGVSLEKWFAKTLISMSMQHDSEIEINENAVSTIFNGDIFIRPFGLYYSYYENQLLDTSNFFKLVPIISNSVLLGGIFEFLGFNYLIILPSEYNFIKIENNVTKLKEIFPGFINQSSDILESSVVWHNPEIAIERRKKLSATRFHRKRKPTQIIKFDWIK